MKHSLARMAVIVLAGLWLQGCSGGSAPTATAGADNAAPPASAQPAATGAAAQPQAQPAAVQPGSATATSPPETMSPPSSAPPSKAAAPDAPRPVVIAVAGADGHGRDTLLAAMRAALSTGRPGGPTGNGAAKPGSGDEVALDAGTRRIIVRDYPSHQALVSALASRASGLGGFILVVAQTDGITQQTREQIVAAGKGRQRLLAVAQTKDELVDDEELKDLEQGEIEQACVDNALLAEADAGTWVKGKFQPGTRLPFVRVSATRALDGDPKAQGRVAQLTTAIVSRAGGAPAR